MNVFTKILIFLDAKWETPSTYGWFHILCLIITAAVAIFLITKYKNCGDKILRKIVCIDWVILLALEIYKQLNFSYDVYSNVWSYSWQHFPFQLCSMPLYFFPLIAFVKDCKFRDACLSFSITYLLFAGVAVMIYPGDVFIETIGVDVQTMFHHGSQVVIGLLLAVVYREKCSLKFFISGVAAFVVTVAAAFVFNVVCYKLVPDQNVNMFFIGPYVQSTLPVLRKMFGVVPWFVILLTYVLGFTAISLIVFKIEIAARNKIRANRK